MIRILLPKSFGGSARQNEPALPGQSPPRVRGSGGLAAICLVTLALPSLPAADFYWNGVGSVGAAGGGTGIWDTTLTNWETAASGGTATSWPATPTGNDDAFFGGTAGTVTVDAGGVGVNDITFSTAGYTVTSGTITLGGTTPTITNAVTATISAPLAGSAGLVKSSNGNLVLNGDNSGLSGSLAVSGATTGNNGGVSINGTAALGGLTAVDVQAGSFLSLNNVTVPSSVAITVAGGGGFSAPQGALRGGGGVNIVNAPVTLADSAVRMGNLGTSTTINGAITAPTGTGRGILFRISSNEGTILTNAGNSWEGTTALHDGSFYFFPGALPSTTGLSLANSGSAWFESNGSFTRAVGSGAGQVSFNATAGRVNGFSARGGDLTVNLGGAAATVTWGSGGFAPAILGLAGSNATGTLTWANPINLNAAARTIEVQDGTAAVDGRISGSLTNGELTKTGGGTLALAGANSFTNSTLTYGTATGLTNLGAIRLENDDALGGVTVIAGNSGTGGAIAQIQLANDVTISGIEYRAGGRSNPETTGAAIVNVLGNNTWAGTIRISNTGGSYGIRSDAGTLTISGSLRNGLGSDRTWDLVGGGDISITGTIEDAGPRLLALRKGGTGTLTIAGTSNTYTGTTTASAGTLRVIGSTPAASAVSVSAGATLAGTGTVGGASTVAGILAPGNNIGVLTLNGAATMNSGSRFAWEIDPTETNPETARGTAFDGINAGSTFAGTGSVFEIVLPGTNDFADPFWQQNRVWTTIVTELDGTTPVSGWAAAFDGGFAYSYNSQTAAPDAYGSFSLQDSTLTWTAVPEPGVTGLAALAGLAGLLHRRWRDGRARR